MEVSSRTSSRAQVTRLINASNEIIKNNEATMEETTVLLARLKTANDSLKAANLAVRPFVEVENLERECESVLDYDDRAVTAITQLEIKLKSFNLTETQNGTNMTRFVSMIPNMTNNASVKLPKMELKKFNGDIAMWIPFWEEFKTAVHENSTLDGTAKFNYLRSVLNGKAAATIAGFTPTEKCYNDAITLLKDEYGSTDRIVEKCTQSLMATPVVKSKSDISGLRNLFNNTSATIRSLNVLGIPTIQYAMMIKSILLRSIPNEMRTNFHRSTASNEHLSENGSDSNDSVITSGSERQVQRLLGFIRNEVEALEKSQDALVGESEKLEQKQKRNTFSTAAGLLAGVNHGRDIFCIFCKRKTHITSDCNSQLTLEQRKDILKRERRCYRCAKVNHSSKQCRVRAINCKKCRGRHMTAMCDPEYNNKIRERGQESNEGVKISAGNSNEKTLNLLTNSAANKTNVYLQTACALITKPENSFSNTLIRLILDGGSQQTFIKECVSRKLGLPIVGTHNISIIPFGTKKNIPARKCNKVRIKLINQYTEEELLIDAIEVPEICLDTLKVPAASDPQLQRFKLADYNFRNIEALPGISLLIGADYYWKIVTNQVEHISQGLVVINTKLGWTVHGHVPVDNCNINLNIVSVMNCLIEDTSLEISKLWDLEAVGIKDNDKTQEEFTRTFSENFIKFKGNYYETSLPWKGNNLSIHNNFSCAKMRLNSLEKRLLKSNKLMEYDTAMFDYINNGIAERVLPYCNTKNNIYYMPHRPVYREDKATTKLRIVFDASAHDLGCASLNDLLLSGSNLIPDLLKILINFRAGKVAIIADIEKAFLQISLNETERDCHRFLWYSDPITSCTNLPAMETYRMTRLTFGVKSSPFILNATILKHLNSQNDYKEICDILKRGFYVDDLVLSAQNLKEAINIYESAKIIMKRAGMNLRKWHSNDINLREKFKDSDISIKVLGVVWYEVPDELGVDLTAVIQFASDHPHVTKRNVLQVISRIYDPLNMLAPFTIKMKILLQEIWKCNPGWEDVLPDPFQTAWNTWKNQLQHLKDFSIPRYVIDSETELHVFVDASLKAYGAVAYVKTVIEDRISVNLLSAKNRVAPLKTSGDKQFTIPRLELTAALLGSRLVKFIMENSIIKVKNVYLWSDSKITLFWIQGEADKWKQYVSNRVREIQSITKGYNWRFCPGTCNPADLLTRGIHANQLSESNLWKYGPSWLIKQEQLWPNDCILEEIAVDVIALNVKIKEKAKPIIGLFQWENHSNLHKIIRITSYIFRFIYNLKFKERKTGNFTREELIDAELYWIKYVQRNYFSDEFTALINKKEVSKKSRILALNPFCDKRGIMRLKGRLQEADLEFDVKHPIILPKDSHFSVLLIKATHRKLHHMGINSVISEIRKRFWIIRGRQLAKSIINKCTTCKRLRGKPGSEPFAPLPRERVITSKTFETTGVDFAGPLYIIQNQQCDVKRYIILFTCAVVRAIHLELVSSLSAESCIKGFRRFIARRGVPKNMYSDNAKAFKRTAKELDELDKFLKGHQLQHFVESHRINWKFIVERAAWWGGWWERMIGTVKTALKSTIGKAKLNEDELQTILIEIEGTINSRPITYVSEDTDEVHPLTPGHFLASCDNLTLPTTFSVNNSTKRSEMISLWQSRERILNKFWKRWSTDYLLQLRSAHQVPCRTPSSLKVNDVVLIHDQATPRLLWKLGKIINVFPGRDGKVRACEVKLANGTQLRRPVQLLYPLEVL